MRNPLPSIRNVVQDSGRRILDLSESANLYLTPEQGRWFEAVLAAESYREAVAEPLANAGSILPSLLENVAPKIGERPLTVVDCGPATADESVRKLRELGRVMSVRRYVVIDVNSRFLSKVKAGVLAQIGAPVKTIQRRFEDLDGHAILGHTEGAALLLFGGTGMNYERRALVRLIRRLCAPGTFVSFESLLRSHGVIRSAAYESDAVIRFAFGPLTLVGGVLEHFDFRLSQARDRLRLEFIARRAMVLDHPDAPHLRAGDCVWTAFSRRPSLCEHQSEASKIARRFDSVILENRVVATLGQVE